MALLLLLYFVEIPVVNAKIVDPDQMPKSAAPDLGLHCLSITLLGSLDFLKIGVNWKFFSRKVLVFI